MSEKIKIVILQNENPQDSLRWEIACNARSDTLQYINVNILASKCLDLIRNYNPNIILTKPSSTKTFYKTIYDEKLTIIEKELGFFCFPTLNEVLIYENKRYLSFWLKAHNIPHPETTIFFSKKEALEYIKKASYPIVAKTNIGASGSGIDIIKSPDDAHAYIQDIFSEKGVSRRVGPNFSKGKFFNRGLTYIFNPKKIISKFGAYKAVKNEKQKGNLLFQEYIEHEFEWRVVRLGDSFFAHKKVKKQEKASGAIIKSYENPPDMLLNFARDITDKFAFYSQAIDIFEFNGKYLVNEMQCIFGQSDPHQMVIDGQPGRYTYQNNEWHFESGVFNTNESFDLRLETAISLYRGKST